MPNAILMSKLQDALNPARLRELLAADESLRPALVEQLGRRGALVDVLHDLVGLEDDERAYLESVPLAVREAMSGAARLAIHEHKDLFFHYSPGYDFEARVMDYGQAVTIHLLGPYPPHPRQAYVSQLEPRRG